MIPPPRLLSANDRAARARIAGLVATMLAAAWWVDPNRPLPFDLCLVRQLTGVPCPTCGLTRAICHALRGDFAGSLALHPVGILALVALVAWGTSAALEAWRGRLLWEEARRPVVRLAAAVAVTITAVSWIGRLA